MQSETRFRSETENDSQLKRRAQSLDESEQTEKTLHHLAGRVEELRARLERVLIPSANGSGGSSMGQTEPVMSPLTERLKSFRKLAQTSINVVEDILSRLDV